MANDTAYTISVVAELDAEALASGAKDASDALADLGDAAKSASGEVDTASGDAAQSLGKVGDATKDSADTVTDAADQMGASIEDVASTATSTESAASSAFGGLGESAGSAAESVQQATDSITDNMDDVSLAADTAATDFEASMGTQIPAAADAGAVNLTTKAGKFKAVGTTLGQNVAQGMSTGISSPEAASSAVSSVAGLIALSAKSASGIAGAAGVGLGVALFAGLIAKSKEARDKIIADIKAWSEAYVAGLGQIDKATRASLIQDAFADPNSALSEIRDQFGSLAEENINVIGKALFGTPEMQQKALSNLDSQIRKARDIYNSAVASGDLSSEELDVLADELRHRFELSQALKDEIGLRQEGKTEAEKILGVLQRTRSLTDEQEAALSRSSETGRVFRERISETASELGRAADNAARMADAINTSREQALELGSAVGNAAAKIADFA